MRKLDRKEETILNIKEPPFFVFLPRPYPLRRGSGNTVQWKIVTFGPSGEKYKSQFFLCPPQNPPYSVLAMSKVSAKAIQHINQAGILLVFPVKNKKDPDSLWSALHPRREMRWDWDETGDDRVVDLWHLMKELSTSRQVVYSKWFQNRATFFSKDCFVAFLATLSQEYSLRSGLIKEAREIFHQLQNDSPLSTKEIKLLTGLQGKFYESLYNKSMKQLYQRGLIVGFGEKEDGAFPSALMGATELIFEDLWRESQKMDLKVATEKWNQYLKNSPALTKQYESIKKGLSIPH